METRCSFCAKHHTEVNKVVAGPGVFICDGCVGMCVEIIASSAEAPVEWPDSTQMTDEEMLEALPRVAAVEKQVDAALRIWVTRLRERGVAWGRIGEALGVTRQTAWGRFSGEE
ncbi:ClpX C4-type zinc finger protein [Allokutzneria multivorans]|uniref:ClpX C4-type zinc finger protein n=1 Tax=Allokutzneria multivorans TaxID=1142134 RepID=A0ABP7TBQ3_9PSEU